MGNNVATEKIESSIPSSGQEAALYRKIWNGKKIIFQYNLTSRDKTYSV
jgi:hypothetical protein